MHIEICCRALHVARAASLESLPVEKKYRALLKDARKLTELPDRVSFSAALLSSTGVALPAPAFSFFDARGAILLPNRPKL